MKAKPLMKWGAMLLLCALPVSAAFASKPGKPEHGASCSQLPVLQVSENGRFLQTEDGEPFFYMADTVWGIYPALTEQEIDEYLLDRAEKRFNVIQTTVAGLLTRANVYGETAFQPRDPLKPYNRVSNPFDPTKPNDAYFRLIDYTVQQAKRHCMYVAISPTWGDNVTVPGSIFTAETARQYGAYLGNRYRDEPVIWLIGGDRNPVEGGIDYSPVFRALAEGIRAESGGKQLMTYHPRGGARSARWFHQDEWLDFNMNQSGHHRLPAPYSLIDLNRFNYNAAPAKPTIDGESGYENIPEGLTKQGTRDPYDPVPDPADRLNTHEIRARAYWNVFSGGMGHAYGANGVYQLTREGVPDSWRWDPQMEWREAMQLPGASQMRHLRALMESRPYFTRIPDQTLIASDNSGTGMDKIVATRDSEGSYVFVYAALGQTFSVHMEKMTGNVAKAYWYNPRNGETEKIGNIHTTGIREFEPPTAGADQDWVLILDDVRESFHPPE